MVQKKEPKISLISYPIHFESEQTGKTFDLVFRYQKFKELREWSEMLASNSKVKMDNKADKMLKLLSNIVIEPNKKEFKEWFEDLYEPEIETFLNLWREAKEKAQKK